MKKITVSRNLEDKADFLTITEAIAKLGADGGEIHIAAGLYYEKLEIRASGVTLVGAGANATVISYDDHATKLFDSGEQYGTFNSQTVYIGSSP